MPQLTASFEGTTELENIPEGTYEAHTHAKTENFVVENGRVIVRADEGKSTNPLVKLAWTIEGGEYDNRKLPDFAHTIMLGGITKKGEAMPLFQLYNFLAAANVPYTCISCKADLQGKKAHKSDGKDGKKSGKYYCPSCGVDLQISYNTDDFVGRKAKIQVKNEKMQGSDKSFPKVETCLPSN